MPGKAPLFNGLQCAVSKMCQFQNIVLDLLFLCAHGTNITICLLWRELIERNDNLLVFLRLCYPFLGISGSRSTIV